MLSVLSAFLHPAHTTLWILPIICSLLSAQAELRVASASTLQACLLCVLRRTRVRTPPPACSCAQELVFVHNNCSCAQLLFFSTTTVLVRHNCSCAQQLFLCPTACSCVQQLVLLCNSLFFCTTTTVLVRNSLFFCATTVLLRNSLFLCARACFFAQQAKRCEVELCASSECANDQNFSLVSLYHPPTKATPCGSCVVRRYA